MSAHRLHRAAKQLEAIYRRADELFEGWACARSGECCQLARTGREPYVWPIELHRVKAAIQASARVATPRADGACPLLDPHGRCSIYADRPPGCRTFYCERGSGPRRVSREAITELMMRVERLSRDVDPDCTGPSALKEELLGAQGDAASTPGYSAARRPPGEPGR